MYPRYNVNHGVTMSKQLKTRLTMDLKRVLAADFLLYIDFVRGLFTSQILMVFLISLTSFLFFL